MLRPTLVSFAFVALGFLSDSPRARADGMPPSVEVFKNLDLLFGTKGPLPSEPVAGSSQADVLREFVRSRMRQDAFYDTVLPRMFRAAGSTFAGTPYVPTPIVLMSTVDNGEQYFHRAGHPCKKEERVDVQPWWKASNVKVCAEAYHPEIKADRAPTTGKTIQYCEATYHEFLNPDSVCRCGEHLLNCARDEQQARQLDAAQPEEFIRTVQYVAMNHRPLGSIFTMNETVRSDLQEFVYARNRFLKTGKFEPLPSVSTSAEKRPTLRPRDPEFEGGVLTTPRILFADPSRRLLTEEVWRDFLCFNIGSLRVEASQVFHVSDPRLRSREHIPLTKMFGCRECHARLENAITAFKNFTIASNGNRYIAPTSKPDPIGFYMKDSSDLRGTGPATPQWVGEMIARQPEFAQCMVKHVGELIYGDGLVPEVVSDSLRQGFEKDQDLAKLFESAVVFKYSTVGAAK